MSLQYTDHFTTPPAGRRLYIRPVNLVAWDSAIRRADKRGAYHRLAGGWMGFCDIDVIYRVTDGPDGKDNGDSAGAKAIATRLSVSSWLASAATPEEAAQRQTMLTKLTAPRGDFASLSMAEPHIMGIVNATPESFSDGGVTFDAEHGIANARIMAEQGATILDIGGESTRPGAEPVSYDEEIRRIIPIITALSDDNHIVSADTRHTHVMAQAGAAGASIINDVGGFRDAGAPELMGEMAQADRGGYAIAMHMQGTPETMQQNPLYDFAPLDVYDWLEERVACLQSHGLPLSHIAIDPGFGFGKTPAHNLEIINWTSLFHGLGVPLLIGVSRKSSIAKLSKGEEATERLGGSLALTMRAVECGAQMIRTHDVAQTAQSISLYRQTLQNG